MNSIVNVVTRELAAMILAAILREERNDHSFMVMDDDEWEQGHENDEYTITTRSGR